MSISAPVHLERSGSESWPFGIGGETIITPAPTSTCHARQCGVNNLDNPDWSKWLESPGLVGPVWFTLLLGGCLLILLAYLMTRRGGWDEPMNGPKR